MANHSLINTNIAFAHLDNDRKLQLTLFAEQVLTEARYKIELHVDNAGNIVWSPLQYMHLPETNAMGFQNGGHVDELVEFTNSVLADKHYRKRLGFINNQFVLQRINHVADDDEPIPDPVDPLFSEAVLVSSIFSSIVEANATVGNQLRIGDLEQRLIAKMAARGILLQVGMLTPQFVQNNINLVNNFLGVFRPLAGVGNNGSMLHFNNGIGGQEDTIHFGPD